MLHSEDDNIFFQEYGEAEARMEEDFLEMGDKMLVHEEIDILSMIN
jgi:hypothetical protein